MRSKTCMTIMAAMALTVLISGCASSYQDRLDALNQPGPAESPTPPADDGLISRNDIPLSGACIINADCATSQYCDLGRCTNDCSADKACPGGLFCSTRGKCVADKNYLDVDPPIKITPPPDWGVDKGVVRLNSDQDGSTFGIQVNSGGALVYRVQVEPASVRDFVTVSSGQGTVGSGGSRDVTVGIDRSSFGPGDHRVSVNVISDGGQRNVIYEFSNGITGRYGGFVSYTDPGLGRVPFVIDLTVDDAGKALGRIVTAGSLLFPEERTLRGQYVASGKTLYLAAVDLVQDNGAHDPFGRPIGREINFTGEINEQGVIKGDLEEAISGLMPQPVTVGAEFYLTRVTDKVDPILAIADPAMPVPAFPIAATAYSKCDGFAAECNTQAGFRSNLIPCSENLRAIAFKLGTTFSSTDAQGDPIVDFGLVNECGKDLAKSGTKACVDIDAFSCLIADQRDYLMHSTPQESEYARHLEDLKGLIRLYAFMGNDKLVDAYRTAVEQVSNPLSTEIAKLNEAIAHYEQAELAFFGAETISLLSAASSSAIAANNYDLLRAPLEFIGAAQSALQRVAGLTLRRELGREDKKQELRLLSQQHARSMFLEGVALAHLVKANGGSFKNELAQVADELHEIGNTASTLEAGLNPLGFSADYVPFIYDPADSQHATNFAQLLTAASDVVTSAVNKADAADAQVEQMQIRTEDVAQKMQQIEQSFESEVEQICGINSLTLLGECGKNGGELALAYNDIAQQYKGIEEINQQIMNVNEMVKIKRDSTLQIAGAKNRTLMFLESSGAQMEALDMASAEVQAAMLRKSSLFGAIGGFVSGLTGIASGVLTMGIGGVGCGIGGVAGGLGSMVNAGLSAAAGAKSAEAAIAQGRIQQQKTHLQNMQQIRIQQEGMEVAAIESAEEVKSLLLQMAELNLREEEANLRLTQNVIHANNLLDRVDYLTHQRDVLMAQQVRSVQNPLSNLSYRIRRDNAVLLAANQFEKALGRIYLAARGLEHELNVELPQIESQLFQAGSARQLADFRDCLSAWNDDYRIAFGSPHEEVTQISVRDDIMGFTRSVTDEVSGQQISPEELFRRVLLNPRNITTSGRVEFPFILSIAGSDKLFSTLVCNDRIRSIRVMLVGDFLGDNEATVMIQQVGDSSLRDCSAEPQNGNDVLNTFHLDQRNALVQAGVNSFGIGSPSYDLTGRSVASDRWMLVIPTGGEAPNNKDVDITHLDDVVIEIAHEARTLTGKPPSSVFGQCNI